MNWHEYLTYDAETGNLIWKERNSSNALMPLQWNGQFAGKVAGHSQEPKAGGAIYIRIHNKMYRAHRIVWEMHNEAIPTGVLVDHIDGDYENNRISNLRLATKSQNGMNRGKSARSSTGLKGVSYCKKRSMYVAGIGINGKVVSLGRYTTKGEAAVAYAKASIRYHGAFSPFMRSSASVSASHCAN